MLTYRASLRLLPALAFLAFAQHALAAQATRTEQLIAASPQLAALDAKLNLDYQSALRVAPDPARLRIEQRAWLSAQRNKCTDAACLVARYTERDQVLRAPMACPVAESALLGNWGRIDDGDFEEFALERSGTDRSFTSWLHQRPEMNGRWTLRDCTLEISSPGNAALAFSFRVAGLRKGVLLLKQADGGAESSYKKLRP
jgi:uncharacterized protein YecT (DUF1311 family)